MDYQFLVSPENLFAAFQEFRCGKAKKEDVMNFERNLETQIFELSEQLKSQKYTHGAYKNFAIWDPKFRRISKASVRDRIVHHALFNYLYDLFDKTFIFHSYSSRLDKGTHLGVYNLHAMMRKITHNFRRSAYALKCDVRQFFATIDHGILVELIRSRVADEDVMWLVKNIIESYGGSTHTHTHTHCEATIGIPLGNVTSQLFANIYLNELDQFVKHRLRVKYYVRYADDFIILHEDKSHLFSLIKAISDFLENNLRLTLHFNKITLHKIRSGIDFLGYICFPKFRLLRTKTKKRMFKKILEQLDRMEAKTINSQKFNQTLQSYLGMLKHANSFKLKQKLAALILTA